MHPVVRPLIAALAASALLVSVVVIPAFAKEGMVATLDAPIAMGTPGGTEIVVGVTVTVPDENGTMVAVYGSPIQLILTGRDGTRTRAAGAAEGESGHYVMRIAIPAGGVRGVEVVMHGTSDLPIRLVGDPLTFGDVSAGTAQVALPPAAPATPFARASAVAAAPVAPAPAADPTEVSSSAGPAPVLLAALGALAVALVLGILAVVRRARATRRLSAAGRAPGA